MGAVDRALASAPVAFPGCHLIQAQQPVPLVHHPEHRIPGPVVAGHGFGPQRILDALQPLELSSAIGVHRGERTFLQRVLDHAPRGAAIGQAELVGDLVVAVPGQHELNGSRPSVGAKCGAGHAHEHDGRKLVMGSARTAGLAPGATSHLATVMHQPNHRDRWSLHLGYTAPCRRPQQQVWIDRSGAANRATGEPVITAKAGPPANPTTDPITAFGLAVGWALIMLGIWILSLALAN